MRPRLDALTIPEGSARYFSIDLDEWRRVQLEGAAAELEKLAEALAKPAPEGKDAAVARGLLKHRRERLTALVSVLEPLPNRGLHHFRFPSFSKANAFVAWTDTDTDPGLSLYHAALVGLFWSHRGMELDARLPARAAAEQWDEFAEAVEDELQDAGYTSQEMALIAGQCDERVAQWLRGRTEAKKLADFTGPKEG